MIKKTLLLVSFLAISLTLIQCSDDSTGPDDSGNGNANTAQRFSGITLTNDKGEILGGDSTDWCYSSGKGASAFSRPLDVVPDGYALYPAYINPSKGPVRIDYDLPVAADVYLYIIDSTEAVIRELVNENKQAGQYAVIWDQCNDSGQFVDSQIYGCLMEAGNFECFGDIRIDSMPDHVILYSETSGDILAVTYKASTRLGAILLVFDRDALAGAPVLGEGSSGMDIIYNTVADDFHIFIYSLSDGYLKDGEHTMLTAPVNGVMILDSVDASNYWGTSRPTAAILNIP
jgi:hypothetical protein